MAGANVLEINDGNFESEVLGSARALPPRLQRGLVRPLQGARAHRREARGRVKGKVKVGKLDIDDSPGVATKFGIRGVPTVARLQGRQGVGAARGRDEQGNAASSCSASERSAAEATGARAARERCASIADAMPRLTRACSLCATRCRVRCCRGRGGARFHLRERIGEGGQGWVFTAAWDEPEGYLVIVKVLRPDAATPESLDALRARGAGAAHAGAGGAAQPAHRAFLRPRDGRASVARGRRRRWSCTSPRSSTCAGRRSSTCSSQTRGVGPRARANAAHRRARWRSRWRTCTPTRSSTATSSRPTSSSPARRAARSPR